MSYRGTRKKTAENNTAVASMGSRITSGASTTHYMLYFATTNAKIKFCQKLCMDTLSYLSIILVIAIAIIIINNTNSKQTTLCIVVGNKQNTWHTTAVQHKYTSNSCVSPASECDIGDQDQVCLVEAVAASVGGSKYDSEWTSNTVSTMFLI